MQALAGLLIKQWEHDNIFVPVTYVAEVHPGLWQTPQQLILPQKQLLQLHGQWSVSTH